MEDIKRKIIEALERSYYAGRFRGDLFFFYWLKGTPVDFFLSEISILLSYDIRVAIAIENDHPVAMKTLERVPVSKMSTSGSLTAPRTDKMPEIIDWVSDKKIRKFFFMVPDNLLTDFSYPSFINLKQLNEILNPSNQQRELIDFSLELLKRGINDVIFLPAIEGNIFREVFTYDGAGVLLSNRIHETIRAGVPADAADIYWLLYPYIKNGDILPMTFDEVLRSAPEFDVYAIDDKIVACGCLKEYGEYAEIAKFATLPRYRGSGKAHRLVKNLIQKTRQMGKKYVFGLSVSEPMSNLFLKEGFEEVERGELPESWKKQYDFSRSSRAFIYQL